MFKYAELHGYLIVSFFTDLKGSEYVFFMSVIWFYSVLLGVDWFSWAPSSC
jgi:hypothetical protein